MFNLSSYSSYYSNYFGYYSTCMFYLTGAAQAVLTNVKAMRSGADPKTLKEKATKKSTPLAPNFRKSEELKQKEKEAEDKKKVKQVLSTKKNNQKNTSRESVERNSSLPRIKKSMSGATGGPSAGNTSPPKIKKSKSSNAMSGDNLSPPKKKSSNNKNIKKSRDSSQKSPPTRRNQNQQQDLLDDLFSDQTSPAMFSIGSPGDELVSPGEPMIINNEKENTISYEKFQPIPSDQTPIIQIENDAKNNNNKNQRIPKSLSTPSIPSKPVKSGPKRKIGTRGGGSKSPQRTLSIIDADPHHALSPSYNIDEDAVPFTFSRPGKLSI